MIIFELGCGQGHRFEGWFASAGDFAQQSAAAMVRCPTCDDAAVAIVPSAKVRVGRQPEPQAPPSAPAAPNVAGAGGNTEAVAGLPAELVRKLREIVRNTENVGNRFPDEARKIHYDEAPARAIRGQASHDEAEALREEGIDFSALPPFLTHEPH